MTGKNYQLELAAGFVQYTSKNIFLTGKAGTGKTTFLQEFRKKSFKRMVVVAPTGVAAINAGGVTIHSFFQMPFGPIIPGTPVHKPGSESKQNYFQRRFSKEKINIIKSLDLLVIDEISMVRADLLDAIDEILRKYRDKSKAFGGVQLLLIGDLQQLAPIAKKEEWDILKPYYKTPFFFSSKALEKTVYLTILLDQIYRQSDEAFIDLLNKVRTNTADRNTIDTLNKRYIPGFINKDKEGYIILTTHNNRAKKINQDRLLKLEGKSKILFGKTEGDFPEYSYPTDIELELKKGAQVMFIKNDPSPEKNYFNGKIGIVEDFDEDQIWIKCENEDDLISVSPHEWENIKYSINKEKGEIEETITGNFIQYPLKLAWAITIHKSQGLTFEKAIIDASSAFAHGQVYVALSRCKSLDGLVLNTPLSASSFINNSLVADFTNEARIKQPDENSLLEAKNLYEQELLSELFSFHKIYSRIHFTLNKIKIFQSSIVGSIYTDLEKYSGLADKEIIQIGEKFVRQLSKLIAKNSGSYDSEEIFERITRGASYFSEKINVFSESLMSLSFESDSKEANKQINDNLDVLIKEVQLKKICLDSCKEGFSISNYLSVKSRAEIEAIVKPKKKVEPLPDSSGDIKNPALYAALINWRNRTAEKNDLPHFMVIHLKTLINLANHQPLSKQELKRVKGIGKKIIENYGDEILEIISRLSGNSLIKEDGHNKKEERKLPVKKTKTATREVSFQMYNDGKTIKEIARERGITESTVENHLALKIASGELDISRLLDGHKIKILQAYFKSAADWSLKTAKELFGEEYSYGELRFVRTYLEFLGEKEKKGG